MVAPHHMRVEVANALYKRMVRGEHTIESVISGVESLLATNIEFVWTSATFTLAPCI